ncbi:fatty acid desaturase family protein [Tautonia marina]|uniref:fatty acid desaturase family protein n=1 Tax=Tautonia marina TaxID=2653855 RepID=UPI001260516E|nr:fatty acid desaturase [Tautonia marina]
MNRETGSDLTWDEVRTPLLAMAKPDNRTNLACIAREYALLVLALTSGSVAFSAWSDGRLPTIAFLPIASAVTVVVAIGQHRLSGLAHEASHFVLFRNRLANELVSDLFLLFPLVALTQRYRAAHWGHHLYVNDPDRDTDLIRLNHPEPHRFPIAPSAFWKRYVLRALWPPAILRYLFGRARAANLAAPEGSAVPSAVYRASVARRLRGAYWLLVFSGVHLSGNWPTFFLFWVVPLLTVYPMVMQLREIAHHANAPDAGDLTNSRIFQVHPLLRFCVFPYGQDFHLTHHLFMSVPHFQIAEAHALLRRWPPYRDRVVVCQGYFFRRRGTEGPSLLELLAQPAPHLTGPAQNGRWQPTEPSPSQTTAEPWSEAA